ncbi:MAG: dTMP kinase [Zetaproteobacteria bacterium]|nr:dTMP kinase [Zetaproteobacteria bacterium]
MKQARFIAVEGGEGTGKSTFCQSLATALQERGQHVVLTREPGGTARAEEIRKVFAMDETAGTLDPWTEMFLICAARRDHMQNLVIPALHAGSWVICDRFEVSTRVYQGELKGLKEQAYFEQSLTLARHGIEVDHYFLLDCPTSVAMTRTQQRTHSADNISRYDTQQESWYEQLRQAYQRTFAQLTGSSQTILDTTVHTPTELCSQALQKLLA